MQLPILLKPSEIVIVFCLLEEKVFLQYSSENWSSWHTAGKIFSHWYVLFNSVLFLYRFCGRDARAYIAGLHFLSKYHYLLPMSVHDSHFIWKIVSFLFSSNVLVRRALLLVSWHLPIYCTVEFMYLWCLRSFTSQGELLNIRQSRWNMNSFNCSPLYSMDDDIHV